MKKTTKIVCVIPARYGSSRFKGKPLSDLCGRPMLWWVHRQVSRCPQFAGVYIATDHPSIAAACERYGLPYLMTSPDIPTSTQRVYAASRLVPADAYVCVNGDEPLIDPAVVEQVIPTGDFFAINLMTPIHSPAQVVDETNIKVVVNALGYAQYMSRSPIPHPKASLSYEFYKHVGVLAYSPEALRFFNETPKGPLEQVEDINELRFIEHGKPLRMKAVASDSLSVDTPKDLEHVRRILEGRLEKGEVTL